jgi:hypothetical protein
MGCAAIIYKQNRQGFSRMPRETPKNAQRKSAKLLENKDCRDGLSRRAYKHHMRCVGAKQLIAPGKNGPMLADLRARKIARSDRGRKPALGHRQLRQMSAARRCAAGPLIGVRLYASARL